MIKNIDQLRSALITNHIVEADQLIGCKPDDLLKIELSMIHLFILLGSMQS
ncbi:MAG: hypothetical protein NVS2B14_08990 [Chamaesiphon sp.]